MLIRANSVTIYARTPRHDFRGDKKPIIFLHGFLGSSSDWNEIVKSLPEKFYPVQIDLIGHGKSDSPEELKHYCASSIINQISEVQKQLNFDRVILCGYSMGGRAALSYAIKYPSKVAGLILAGSTAGIENLSERKIRREKDKALTENISRSMNEFLIFWYNQELFKSLASNKKKLEQIIYRRGKNNRTGLKNILLKFGTGSMPSYWKRINSFRQKVLLINGEYDNKFAQINYKMQSLFPAAEVKTVKACSHAVHIEKPYDFSILLNNFLKNF